MHKSTKMFTEASEDFPSLTVSIFKELGKGEGENLPS